MYNYFKDITAYINISHDTIPNEYICCAYEIYCQGTNQLVS